MQDSNVSPSGPDIADLMRGWKVLFACTLSAMAVGAALLLIVTPQQEVSAKLIVEHHADAFDTGKSKSGDREFLPTQAEVLRSPAVIESALRQIDAVPADVPVADLIRSVTADLQIDPLAGTSILLVRYAHPDAEVASDFVDALIAGYSSHLTLTQQQQHRQLLEALLQRDRELNDELQVLQREYEQLKRTTVDLSSTDPFTTARIMTGLEESLAALQVRRSRLEQVAERLDTPVGATLTRAVPKHGGEAAAAAAGVLPFGGIDAEAVLTEIAALGPEYGNEFPNPGDVRERLRQAQELFATVSQTLGSQHPEFKAAEAAVQRSESEWNRVLEAAPTFLVKLLERLRREEQALQQRYDQFVQQSSSSEVGRMLETQKLAEIARAEKAYETAHAQLQEWQLADHAIAAGRAGVTVAVLEPPVPAERSFVTSPLIVLGAAGIVGLLAGVVLVTALPQFRSLWSRSQPMGLNPSRG